MSEAFIVLPGEGRALDLGNFEAVVLATAHQTSGEFTLLQTQSEPPGIAARSNMDVLGPVPDSYL